MAGRWYKEAVIYSLEVDSFQDSDADGCGDLQGLISRLDYLARLGVTCLWLNPIHPSPQRDAGYDVTDYYAVDPRLGSLGDFVELCRHAQERGIRILLDLVVNHTSDEHPWFRSARSAPDSPYRDWYVWSQAEPDDRFEGTVFRGEQRETWTWTSRRVPGSTADFRLPARPELVQPCGASRGEQDHRVLAAAGGVGVSRRRRAVHPRAAVHPRRVGRA